MQSNNPYYPSHYNVQTNPPASSSSYQENSYYAPPSDPRDLFPGDSKEMSKQDAYAPEQPYAHQSTGYSQSLGSTRPKFYDAQHHSSQGPPMPPPPSYSERSPAALQESHTPIPSQPYFAARNAYSVEPSPGPSRPPLPPRSSLQQSMSHSTSRDPLNPPPASFSRPAPPYLGQGAYAGNPTGSFPQIGPFPPMRLLSNGESLGDGFPNLQPACVYQPHPFLQRDVTEVDWIRFLEDIQLTGRISGTQRVVANVLPMAMSVGFVGGIFVTRAIEKRMKKKKSQPAGELVDTWNDHFFHPRRLHVILAQGPENISGDVDGPAPDWQGSQGGRSRRARSRSSSSSSSSSDDDKRGRRRHHSSRKSERKAEKRAGRAMKNEKFRLVVLSI